MGELKLYNVSDRYINYLRNFEPRVYSNKEDVRVHYRKYLGIILKLNEINYYVPLSSAKNADYLRDCNGNFILDKNGNRKIKKDIPPIIRIIEKISDNKETVLGTIRFSNMIPVPDSEIELYDLNSETDMKYKNLITKELNYIRKNHNKIIKNANLIYNSKKANVRNSPNYIKNTVEFAELEKRYLEFIEINL